MRPIVGGNVPPNRVVGRDTFIEKMWNALENQSVVLIAERRIGKTSVLRKMEKEAPKGWYPIYLVVEGVRSPTEFIAKIVDTLSPLLTQKGKIFTQLQSFYSGISGQKVGNWELPEIKNNWKRLLQATLNDIKENLDDRVVFLWDELPLMISNIKDDMDVKTAMELLDVLRDIRVADDSGKLRMVYTGSIGLHLVVSELSHQGYRNDPTNDMVTYSLEGLDPADAKYLACQGLNGLIDEDEITITGSADAIAQAIAQKTDGLPYYINYLVERLSEMTQPIELESVDTALEALILDPEDTAHFRHYAERIESYYIFHKQAKELAFIILKHLCHEKTPITETAIWETAIAQIELTDKNFFQAVLELLMKDHYLTRTVQGTERRYQFKYDIIKQWWLKNRG